MSVLNDASAFSPFFTAPLAHRLRARSLVGAVQEIEEVVAAHKTSDPPIDEIIQPGIELLVREITSVDAGWKSLMGSLEQTGVPGILLIPVLSSVRTSITAARDLIALVRQHTDSYTVQIDDAATILDRIDSQVQVLEEVQAAPAPAFDEARLGESIAQMERGEGEDAGEILKRVRQTGEL